MFAETFNLIAIDYFLKDSLDAKSVGSTGSGGGIRKVHWQ